MSRCPFCRIAVSVASARAFNDYACGTRVSSPGNELIRQSDLCAETQDVMDESHDFAYCHLFQSDSDPDLLRHSFTSHEEDACIFLATYWPKQYELVDGGVKRINS